jgi:glycosyltransferase involved in cell wall biosynthesis
LEGFSLDIIGKGPLKGTISKKARNLGISLNFLGEFPNNKLPELMNKYPIFILPSYYEGNPKVLLEAMSCGLACIGSDVWGINNIIEHQYNGYLCESTPQSIAEAIEKVYNNKDLANEIAKNARKFILKNCSLNSIVNKEYMIYRNLLK